jgi:hypothetical protein
MEKVSCEFLNSARYLQATGWTMNLEDKSNDSPLLFYY